MEDVSLMHIIAFNDTAALAVLVGLKIMATAALELRKDLHASTFPPDLQRKERQKPSVKVSQARKFAIISAKNPYVPR